MSNNTLFDQIDILNLLSFTIDDFVSAEGFFREIKREFCKLLSRPCLEINVLSKEIKVLF